MLPPVPPVIRKGDPVPRCERLGLGRGKDTTGGWGSLRLGIEGGVVTCAPCGSLGLTPNISPHSLI